MCSRPAAELLTGSKATPVRIAALRAVKINHPASIGQNAAGPRRIVSHLSYQRVEVGEPLLLTQLGHELHLYLAAVQVTSKVKQVRFQQHFPPACNSGARSQACNTRQSC